MKKCTYFVLIVFTFSLISAGYAQASDLRFEKIYEVPLWQNGWVIGAVITTAAVGASVFTTVTAGTGAPAAAAGVSSVASTVAGGGAGSYMAGLSIVGGWVGGNAITGAAILNGMSVAILGGTAKGMLPVAKLAILGLETLEFGVTFMEENTEKNNIYLINLVPSDQIGSEHTEALLDKIEELNDALRGEEVTAKMIAEVRLKSISNDARELLERTLRRRTLSQDEREDAIMGSVILHSLGFTDDFIQNIMKIDMKGEGESFLLFLKSVASFLKGDFREAENYALRSCRSEPQAIEPVMIRIMALDKMGQYAKALSLESALEKFDDDHYNTPNSLKTAYNLLGDISSSRGHYDKALHYYNKAADEMGFFDDDNKKAVFFMKISNSHDKLGAKGKSKKYYEKAMDYVEDKRLKKVLGNMLIH